MVSLPAAKAAAGSSETAAADPARNVRREEAMAHVAGYTVANDYAIRDYLEN